MNPTLEQIVDALIECAPPVIAAVAVKRARCIAATMTGLTVLEHVGVTATPRPVAVECFNPVLVAWVREHPDAWPPSKADAADLERRGAKVLLTGPVRVTADGFPGHLVIAIDAITVDLDTQQFARPDAGIAMPPAVAFQWPEYPDPVGWEAEGSLLIYRALDDDSWRSGVDVGRRNDRVFRWVAGQIIRAMRRTLRDGARPLHLHTFMTTPISTLPASPAIQIVPAHARRAARFDLRVLTMNPPAFEAALTAQRARCERLTALGAPGPILRYERDRLTVYTDAQGPRSAPTRRKARAADLRAWLASHPACLWSIADAKHRCTTACSIQPAVYIATCSPCGRMHRELGVHVNGWCPSWMCKRPQGDGQPFTFTRVLADPQRLSRDC